MENYSALEKKEIMNWEIKWFELEDVLGEVTQT